MSRNVRRLKCRPEDVFAVLADGWLYPAWVVGATRMRRVDPTWPQKGAKVHHSVGIWPALIDDVTESLEWNPPRSMTMRARGWPIGEARVVLHVRPAGDETLVRIQEEAAAGPALLIPRPIRTLVLYLRNRETLDRLAFLAEGKRRVRAS